MNFLPTLNQGVQAVDWQQLQLSAKGMLERSVHHVRCANVTSPPMGPVTKQHRIKVVQNVSKPTKINLPGWLVNVGVLIFVFLCDARFSSKIRLSLYFLQSFQLGGGPGGQNGSPTQPVQGLAPQFKVGLRKSQTGMDAPLMKYAFVRHFILTEMEAKASVRRSTCTTLQQANGSRALGLRPNKKKINSMGGSRQGRVTGGCW